MKTEIKYQTAIYKIITNINTYVKQDIDRLRVLEELPPWFNFPERSKERQIRKIKKRIKHYLAILTTLPKM